MLAFMDEGRWVEWTGQQRPFSGDDGALYSVPQQADGAYSRNELAAYGLARVAPAEVPKGYAATGYTLMDDAGSPKQVLTLEAIPGPSANPADYQLTKRQICAALIVSGVTTDPEGWMTDVLGQIVDPIGQALALNDWRNAPYYTRDNPLFNDADLLSAAGMTAADIDRLWLAAKDLPA